MLNKSQTNVKRETFKTYFHNFFQKKLPKIWNIAVCYLKHNLKCVNVRCLTEGQQCVGCLHTII